MADSHPTGRVAVPLRTPERHRDFLLDTLSTCRRGLADDLAEPDQLADLESKWLEAETYDRLIAAIKAGSVIPDPGLQRVVEALLDATDTANEYGRVVAEHAAHVGLLDQLERRRS